MAQPPTIQEQLVEYLEIPLHEFIEEWTKMNEKERREFIVEFLTRKV